MLVILATVFGFQYYNQEKFPSCDFIHYQTKVEYHSDALCPYQTCNNLRI